MAKSTILESMPAKLGAAARRSGMPISPGWRRNERKRLWTATPPPGVRRFSPEIGEV
jgi:hypothetical protein